MPSNGENPKPKRVRGKHRDTMVVKIPVDREEVAQAGGSYQRLAGMYFAKLKVMAGAAIEAQKEALRHQAEANRLTAQFAAAAQIEDHRAEVEVEDEDETGTTAAN